MIDNKFYPCSMKAVFLLNFESILRVKSLMYIHGKYPGPPHYSNYCTEIEIKSFFNESALKISDLAATEFLEPIFCLAIKR